MVNPLADNSDTMVEDEPTVLTEQGQEMDQGQEMREHTPRPQLPAPAPSTQTPEPPPRSRTLETHTLSGLELLGLVTPQKPRPAVVLATVPGFLAAVQVWNRTGCSRPSCYPENRGTHWVR